MLEMQQKVYMVLQFLQLRQCAEWPKIPVEAVVIQPPEAEHGGQNQGHGNGL